MFMDHDMEKAVSMKLAPCEMKFYKNEIFFFWLGQRYGGIVQAINWPRGHRANWFIHALPLYLPHASY